jgi:hypothetical protein
MHRSCLPRLSIATLLAFAALVVVPPAARAQTAPSIEGSTDDTPTTAPPPPPPQHPYGYFQGPAMPAYLVPPPPGSPTGFHYELRPRYGLVIGGSITFGVFWMTSVSIGIGFSDYALVVPVIGPFLDIHPGNDGITNMYLMLDGLAQTAGMAMLLAGALTRKKVLVRDGFTVLPTHNGLVAMGTF